MKQSMMDKMDLARDYAGIPLVMVCAYRSPEWDRARGRSGTGDHPLREGIDILCNTSANRFIIVQALLKAGFTRIGIHKTFIHAGNSQSNAQEVIWLY